ncbi:MAG: beta-lactamase family protein [Candidatus Hydrogenedentes bacterium]|nr:beta-lactamase family protein [Candidatus Hydrogenedentota bacterium]
METSSPFSALESRWSSAVEELGLPGFSVAVVQRDHVIYSKGFGLRSLSPKEPFTSGTPVYIASVTKTFVALAIVQLAEQGKLDLDAPVKTYLPRLQLADAGLSERLTIRDLLCHRYGISNWPITFAEAYSGLITDDLYYRELPDSDVKGSWDYSNLHFTLLGRVIQAVSGESWQEYLRDHILAPAGMPHTTGYASVLYGFDHTAQPMVLERGEWRVSPLRKTDATMHAAGGMGSSADDLARWIRLHLNDGEIDGASIVSRDSIAAMLNPEVEPGTRFFRFDRPLMGLGWYLGEYEGERLVHHFGSYVGAHAHVSFMPEHGIGVAVVANSDDKPSMLVHLVACDVYDALLDLPGTDGLPSFIQETKLELKRDAAESPDSVASKSLQLALPVGAYTGTYRSDRWGELVVREDGNGLSASIGALPIEVRAADGNLMSIESPLGDASLKFVVTDGEAVTAVQVLSSRGVEMEFAR